MQITEHEIRLKLDEAGAILNNRDPQREFIEAVYDKMKKAFREIQSGSSNNAYVTVEVYDY